MTRKTVLNSVLWNSLTTLLSLPVLAVTTILLARVLGARGFGRYSLYTFLIALLGGLADLGVGITILRRGALAAGSGDEFAVMAAVRAGLTWTLFQLPWNLALGFLVLPTWTAGAMYAFATLESLVFIGPSHYLVMTNQLRVPSLIALASGPLVLAAAIGTALSTHRPDLAFGASAIAGSSLAFVQFFALPKRFRRSSFLPGRIRLSRSDITFGLGNLINVQLNNFVFSKSELLFFGSGRQLARGDFAASQTIAARSTLVPDALLGNLSLGMTSALGKGHDILNRSLVLLSDTVALLFILIAPLTLAGIAVLAEPVLGHGYEGIAAPAVALGLLSLLQTSAAPLISIRFAEKSIRPLIMAGAVGACLDLAFAIVLVPYAGVTGAVIASASGTLGYLGCMVMLFRRRSAIRKLALSYMIRMTVVVAYSGVLAAGLLWAPRTLGIALAGPLSIVWTVLGFRLRPMKIKTPVAIDALCESLPGALSRVLRAPRVRWLLAQTG